MDLCKYKAASNTVTLTGNLVKFGRWYIMTINLTLNESMTVISRINLIIHCLI